VLDRFEQIRMTDVEYTVGTEGSRVFVTSRGDYRQGDGTAGWRSVSAAASPRGRPPGQCQAGGASQRIAGGPGVASAATSRDDADSGAISDSAILNFALNLEYLEANFYSFAVHGHAIPGSLMSGTGNQGGISGGAQVPFKSKGIRQLAREIAGDELAHVTASRPPKRRGPAYDRRPGAGPGRTRPASTDSRRVRVILPGEPPRLTSAAARALLDVLLKARAAGTAEKEHQ